MPSETAPRPRIAVISTGGTIASIRAEDGGPASPRLTAEAMVAAVPMLAKIADIETTQFRQVSSSDLALSDIIALAEEVARMVAQGAAGVVVTQGTDTMEETAFALDLLWSGDAPVVVTGAMRNPTLPGADGPANLLAATQVAASPGARGHGVLLVFSDEIHLPLFVRKTHTSSTATFRSMLTGPIGWLVEDRTRIAVRPVARHHVRFTAVPDALAPVALLKIGIGDDGRLLPTLASLGFRGLVIEAFGGGHVPSAMVPLLAQLAGSIPVVLASRTGAGEGLQSTYGFAGSETDLLHRGLIPAGILDGPKARVLLTLLLSANAPVEAIRRAFATIGAPDAAPGFRWPGA